MYNRYHDIKKFITDPEKLQIVNGSEVYISNEEDYDIVVDLKGHTEEFESRRKRCHIANIQSGVILYILKTGTALLKST